MNRYRLFRVLNVSLMIPLLFLFLATGVLAQGNGEKVDKTDPLDDVQTLLQGDDDGGGQSGEGGDGEDPVVCMYSRTAGSNYAQWIEEIPYQVNGQTHYAFGKYQNNTIYISNAAGQRTQGWSFDFPKTRNAANQNWVHVDIDVDNAPDFVNLTYAHEKTHKLIDQAGGPDGDGDGVPDAWEIQIPGMKANSLDSFGSQFTVSIGGGARDNEFYCVIGGGMLSEFGSVKVSRDGPKLNADRYHGKVPQDANEDADWSVGGKNWE